MPDSPDPSNASDPRPPASLPSASGPSRRTILTIAAVAGAGAAAGILAPPALNRLANSGRSAVFQVLSPDEASLLDSICEQVIPADQDAGAHDAGVVHFIDRQLAGPYQRFSERYRKGLAATQATCRALYQRPFESLAWDEQTSLLRMLEASNAPREVWQGLRSGDFFRMVVSHTMQGFYGSPRHGGNRDYASYRMLKLEYPRVIGRNRIGG